MSNLFSMLSIAGDNARKAKFDDPSNAYAKRRATMYAKSKAKWGGAFAHFGGSAPTVVVGRYLGHSNATTLNTLIRFEGRGWVRRVGKKQKDGRGPQQVVWEWVADAD